MTPYSVADLVFDWSGHGEVVQVAVVARETLAEAEAFAETHGFGPVSFVAMPAPGHVITSYSIHYTKLYENWQLPMHN